jgi:hypothetical protein
MAFPSRFAAQVDRDQGSGENRGFSVLSISFLLQTQLKKAL